MAGCGDDGGESTGADTTDAAPRQLYRVPTELMEPTLQLGQIVQLDVEPGRIAAGDVVVFLGPVNATSGTCAVRRKRTQACPRSAATTLPDKFIKRVVAVGGDRLVIEGGRARVNGKLEPDRFIPDDSLCRFCNLATPVTVPRGQLYVLSDRRDIGSDSRNWGPIRRRWVVGKMVPDA